MLLIGFYFYFNLIVRFFAKKICFSDFCADIASELLTLNFYLMARFLKTHHYKCEDFISYIVLSQEMYGIFYVGDVLQIVKWGG